MTEGLERRAFSGRDAEGRRFHAPWSEPGAKEYIDLVTPPADPPPEATNTANPMLVQFEEAGAAGHGAGRALLSEGPTASRGFRSAFWGFCFFGAT